VVLPIIVQPHQVMQDKVEVVQVLKQKPTLIVMELQILVEEVVDTINQHKLELEMVEVV
jgi:hypothetical protein